MANRRMFSKEVTSSSEFLMMSQSAQNLYFHIGMNSDDDGFCEIFTIMRMTESKPDDLSILHSKGFVFVIDNKICIVKDWHENNQMRADRYKKSKYLNDAKFREIYLTIMSDKIKNIEQYKSLLEQWQPNGNQMETQVRLGKVRLDKNNTDSVIFSEDFLLYWKEYPNKTGKLVAYKSWKKINPSIALQAKMINTLNKQKNSEQWQKEKGRFIPNPATWLNQGRWDDEIKENKPKIQYF